jgi:hypothetical protein
MASRASARDFRPLLHCERQRAQNVVADDVPAAAAGPRRVHKLSSRRPRGSCAAAETPVYGGRLVFVSFT